MHTGSQQINKTFTSPEAKSDGLKKITVSTDHLSTYIFQSGYLRTQFCSVFYPFSHLSTIKHVNYTWQKTEISMAILKKKCATYNTTRINKARQVYSNTIKSKSCPLEQHDSQCEALELCSVDFSTSYSNSLLSRASFTNNLHDNQQQTLKEKSMWSDHSLKKQAATQHPISEQRLSSQRINMEQLTSDVLMQQLSDRIKSGNMTSRPL